MQNRIFFILIGLLFIGIIYLLSPVLTPFLMGALLAYLVDPLVNQLMKYRIPRLGAVIIVFMFLLGIVILTVLLVIPLIQSQFGKLGVFFPKMVDWFQLKLLPNIEHYIGTENIPDAETIKTTLTQQIPKAGSYAGAFLQTILHSSALIFTWLMNLMIIPVVTFYLLRDWDRLMKGIRKRLPKKYEPEIVDLARQCDHVLGAFFRGQLLVMLVIGIYYSIGLTVIGLDIGLILGMLIGLISIVPYLEYPRWHYSGKHCRFLCSSAPYSLCFCLAAFYYWTIIGYRLSNPNLLAIVLAYILWSFCNPCGRKVYLAFWGITCLTRCFNHYGLVTFSRKTLSKEPSLS